MKLTLRDTPIRKKLIAAILLTCGAVLLLTCATFYTYDALTFRSATVRHLRTLGNIVADNSTAAGRQLNRRVDMIVSGDVIGSQAPVNP